MSDTDANDGREVESVTFPSCHMGFGSTCTATYRVENMGDHAEAWVCVTDLGNDRELARHNVRLAETIVFREEPK